MNFYLVMVFIAKFFSIYLFCRANYLYITLKKVILTDKDGRQALRNAILIGFSGQTDAGYRKSYKIIKWKTIQ